MERLFEGIKRFCQRTYPQYRPLFEQLSGGQQPHTLFIACSDSRVHPALITDSDPGELFVIRNVANIIPPYPSPADPAGTLAAVEYAVQVLGVKNIVVCGHSNCGGCRALLDEEASRSLPRTREWLKLARAAKEQAQKRHEKTGGISLYRLIEQENIILQMRNLLSHPFIRDKQDKGDLQVYGWYYDIGRGEVLNYNSSQRQFESIS